MQAEIITIGDEILIGQVVDTNSAWMGQKLNLAGIRVAQITSISDKADKIKAALNAAFERSSIVLMTGGLGPTKDDITKSTLAEYFNMPLRTDEETLRHVEDIFRKLNRPLLPVNLKQAEVPSGCIVIKNQNGTAPCMWFEFEGKILVAMPGVPFEMKYLMEEAILPKLIQRFKLPHLYHKTILTANIGESFLAELIGTIADELPQHISLAYLPKLGQVRLRLSGEGWDKESLEVEVDAFARRIIEKAFDYVVAEVDTSLDAVVLKKLFERNFTLSAAESCTGGLIGHLLTSNEGSASVFKGGAITYSNEAKHNILNVSNETLENFGAVSEETVREMALGALEKFNSDYSIATTGIAGPGGEEPGKPVGTIWIAVAHKGEVVTKLLNLNGKRLQNIERAAMSTFIMLLNHLKYQAK